MPQRHKDTPQSSPHRERTNNTTPRAPSQKKARTASRAKSSTVANALIIASATGTKRLTEKHYKELATRALSKPALVALYNSLPSTKSATRIKISALRHAKPRTKKQFLKENAKDLLALAKETKNKELFKEVLNALPSTPQNISDYLDDYTNILRRKLTVQELKTLCHWPDSNYAQLDYITSCSGAEYASYFVVLAIQEIIHPSKRTTKRSPGERSPHETPPIATHHAYTPSTHLKSLTAHYAQAPPRKQLRYAHAALDLCLDSPSTFGRQSVWTINLLLEVLNTLRSLPISHTPNNALQTNKRLRTKVERLIQTLLYTTSDLALAQKPLPFASIIEDLSTTHKKRAQVLSQDAAKLFLLQWLSRAPQDAPSDVILTHLAPPRAKLGSQAKKGYSRYTQLDKEQTYAAATWLLKTATYRQEEEPRTRRALWAAWYESGEYKNLWREQRFTPPPPPNTHITTQAEALASWLLSAAGEEREQLAQSLGPYLFDPKTFNNDETYLQRYVKMHRSTVAIPVPRNKQVASRQDYCERASELVHILYTAPDLKPPTITQFDKFLNSLLYSKKRQGLTRALLPSFCGSLDQFAKLAAALEKGSS